MIVVQWVGDTNTMTGSMNDFASSLPSLVSLLFLISSTMVRERERGGEGEERERREWKEIIACHCRSLWWRVCGKEERKVTNVDKQNCQTSCDISFWCISSLSYLPGWEGSVLSLPSPPFLFFSPSLPFLPPSLHPSLPPSHLSLSLNFNQLFKAFYCCLGMEGWKEKGRERWSD